MSSQDCNLTDRVVKAQEDMKRLKATQIVGSSNISYYEYRLPRMESTVQQSSGKYFLFLVSSKTPFPLVSIEFKIQEQSSGNWVDRPNPWGSSPTAYDAQRDSSGVYSCYDNESIISIMWGVNYLDLYGRRFNFSDPSVYGYLVYVGSTQSSTTFAFDNILVRTSSLCEVWLTDVTGEI